MLLEAVGADAASEQWQSAFARTGSAAMYVELEGKQVWLRDQTRGIAETPMRHAPAMRGSSGN